MKSRISALFAFLCLVSSPSFAVVIIDNASTGLYNAGIGDIASIDGAGGFLPGANSSEGDPTITLVSDPGLAFTAEFGADWLAGDYTDHGLPATLEGAVRSGVQSAQRLLRERQQTSAGENS